jgi:hypothetical protein
VGQGLIGALAPSHHAPASLACQAGRYGKRCMPCKCNNYSSCHPSNGTCYCLAGWTGPDCSQCEWWLCVLRGWAGHGSLCFLASRHKGYELTLIQFFTWAI